MGLPRLRLPGLALVALLVSTACGEDPEPLPQLSQVPAFTLQSHSGGSVSLADLQGKVWVANFIFTSCPDVCPLLTKKMSDLRTGIVRRELPVQFVSFSVDPETDTPDVLRAYAEKHHASHDDWHFLTGPIGDVKQVVANGFRQRIERDPDKPANVFHGSHFVLVDRAGMIRGFYRSEHEGLLQLAQDAGRLLEESP